MASIGVQLVEYMLHLLNGTGRHRDRLGPGDEHPWFFMAFA
jgi:hypothetical protein